MKLRRTAPTKKPSTNRAVVIARYALYTAIVTSLIAPLLLRIVDALLK
jgi:hypothetical protein